MLRINTLRRNDRVVLQLQGKLLAPWVAEVSAAFEDAHQHAEVGLDLHDVTYADSAGAEVLRAMIRQGAAVEICSNFVTELLEGADRA